MVPSHRDSLSLLLGAWFYVARSAVLATALVLCAIGAWHQDPRWLRAASYGVPLWFGLTVLVLTAGPRARCAVCTGALFNVTRNAKHSTARRCLGSYRLWTALQVVFAVAYRCHHCGAAVCCHHAPKHSRPRARTSRNRGRRPQPQIVLNTRLGDCSRWRR